MSTLVHRAVRLALVAAAASGLVIGASLSVSATPVAVPVTVSASGSSTVGTPDAWTSPRGGAGNASANLGETQISSVTAPTLTRAWTRPANYAGFYSVTIVDGVAYTTKASGNALVPWHLVAFDVRTGTRLWQLVLPLGSYYRGVTVSGRTAVLPYDGHTYPGGVIAVDLATRRVLWNTDLGFAANGMPNTVVETATVDAGRVVMGTGNGLSAFDLAKGGLLWSRDFAYPRPLFGYAAAGGVVYAGSYGVLALDGATGRVLWQGDDGIGQPVIADGHVIVPSVSAVSGYLLGGCGAANCHPQWQAPLGPGSYEGPVLGGAGNGTVFAAYVNRSESPFTSRLLRIDTSTGAVEWKVPLAGISGLVLGRAGDLVWTTTPNQAGGTRLTAYAATGARTTPVTSFREPGDGTYPQGFAIADGSLVLSELNDGLFAFRVPAATTR